MEPGGCDGIGEQGRSRGAGVELGDRDGAEGCDGIEGQGWSWGTTEGEGPRCSRWAEMRRGWDGAAGRDGRVAAVEPRGGEGSWCSAHRAPQAAAAPSPRLPLPSGVCSCPAAGKAGPRVPLGRVRSPGPARCCRLPALGFVVPAWWHCAQLRSCCLMPGMSLQGHRRCLWGVVAPLQGCWPPW